MTQEIWGKWDANTPPVAGAVLTERGWEIPLKGTNPEDELTEVIVAIRQGNIKAGASRIASVAFSALTLVQDEEYTVTVTFTEKVNVEAGATLSVLEDDGVEPATAELTAEEQLDTNTVVFTGSAPSKAATLTIEAQTITGTVTDADGEDTADLEITEAVALAAGEAVVPAIASTITAVAFDEASYVAPGTFTVTVTYNEEVSVEAGATLVVTSDGAETEITATAAAQAGVTDVVFTADLPEEAVTLSIEAQDIVGVITDDNDAAESDLTITSDLATAAGTSTVTV